MTDRGRPAQDRFLEVSLPRPNSNSGGIQAEHEHPAGARCGRNQRMPSDGAVCGLRSFLTCFLATASSKPFCSSARRFCTPASRAFASFSCAMTMSRPSCASARAARCEKVARYVGRASIGQGLTVHAQRPYVPSLHYHAILSGQSSFLPAQTVVIEGTHGGQEPSLCDIAYRKT